MADEFAAFAAVTDRANRRYRAAALVAVLAAAVPLGSSQEQLVEEVRGLRAEMRVSVDSSPIRGRR